MEQPDRVQEVYDGLVKRRKLAVEEPLTAQDEQLRFIYEQFDDIQERIKSSASNIMPETLASDLDRVEWLKRYVSGADDVELAVDIKEHKRWRWPLGGMEGFAANSLGHVIKRASEKTHDDVSKEQYALQQLYRGELLPIEQYDLDEALYSMAERPGSDPKFIGGLFVLFGRKDVPANASEQALHMVLSQASSQLRSRLTDFESEKPQVDDKHLAKGLDMLRYALGSSFNQRKSMAAVMQRSLMYRDYESSQQVYDDVTTHIAYTLQELYPPEQV